MTEIYEIRMRSGLTQQELSERSGVAQPNIAAYESGKRKASTAMLERLRSAAPARPSVLLAEHRDQIREAANRHRGVAIRVFGSTARGEDGSGSDLDLLVRFDQDASIFDQAELIEDLRDLLGINVDVISEGDLGPNHAEILAQAVPL